MIRLPSQPKCGCFECNVYGLVYSSIMDVYKCLECKTTVRFSHIENIVEAYAVFRSANPPILIPNYNAINCISCLKCGGVTFKDAFRESVFCNLCKYSIPVYQFHDAMVNAYRTKLIERTYNSKYAVFNQGTKNA